VIYGGAYDLAVGAGVMRAGLAPGLRVLCCRVSHKIVSDLLLCAARMVLGVVSLRADPADSGLLLLKRNERRAL